MRYIILDGKTPTHGFKDGEGTYSKEEAMEFDNVAAIVPKGFVVLDFDTESDAEIMLRIIDGLQLKTKVVKTTRGIHCWFRSPEEHPKNYIKNRLAVGIYCDRKAGGRNAYVKIKQDGQMRETIRPCSAKDIEVLPRWLTSVSAPGSQFAFQGMGEGSGRNQELFNYIVYLQTKGFSKDEIRTTIEIINEYVFDEPLPDSEIATICRDEAFKSEEELEADGQRGGFDHVAIGNKIIEDHNLISVNGLIYEYRDHYYQRASFLRKYVREAYFGAKRNQVAEVIDYINDMERIEDVTPEPYIINLQNTRLDIRTGKCLEFTPAAIEFDRIPVTYDQSAYCADLDKMLNRVFRGDREVIDLFEEMLGYCLIKHCRYQKAFLFYGGGSNGKSTILDMIKRFLGDANYSAISLENVCGRFNTVELEHKLANIGDDINNTEIRDSGTLKKIITGNAVAVERKGQDPFTLTPYAVHIYSCNTIPRSFDKTEGFYRRWMLIPFNAVFSNQDEDYDPMIEDKISTPKAMSYLLNLAIKGARRLIQRGKFNTPDVVAEALDAYRIENSTTLSWVAEEDITKEDVLEKSRDELYILFTDWCKTSGIRPSMVTGKKAFYKTIRGEFHLAAEDKQRSDGKRYFSEK